MFSIPNTSGVYILVFYLAKATSIAFDRKGSRHKFPPGWYLYVGSACGVGGLNRRLARHQSRIADGKRMHWNVDYFREHAMLCEIWYCETDDYRFEHHLAQTVADLSGATVPVPKFGASDCKSDCPSHFFHLSGRPSTALFRSFLKRRGLSTTVSVEFIAEPRGQRSALGFGYEYFIRRRFLEVRNHAMRDSDLEPDEWTSLAERRPARLLAESVAKEMKVTFPKLKDAITFATAIETLIENCSESVWTVLFDPMQPQKAQAILKLSRTSDVRQRHRVNGVIERLFRSIAPHSDDTVFDTVKYGEVPNRLARALGSLEELQNQLNKTHQGCLVREAKRLSRLCRLSAQRLDKCLRNRVAPASAVPRYLGKEIIMGTVRSKVVKGRMIGMGRSALRLIVKNVWDFEEMMRRGLVPTEQQLQDTLRDIKQIQETARLIDRQVVRS